jgi:hypothetical protein
MHIQFRLYVTLGAWAALLGATSAFSAVTNSLIMNEVNTVSGEDFIDKGRSDAALGRVEGNGQNWWELLVVASDPGKNTLDLRGWKIDWSYHKLPSVMGPDNLNDFGSGVITFSSDPLWAAVPRGTLLTISEWKDVWYEANSAGQDPFPGAGGLQRAGGIAGTGNVHGVPYDELLHTKIGLTPGATSGADPFHTNTYWNPGANGGGANGDWRIHVFAGEGKITDTTYQYFSFSGSVTTNSMSGPVTHPIGSDEAGLFAINNDLWRYTIKDAQDNVVQGPIGEWDPASWNPETMSFGAGVPGSVQSVSSVEIYRLEAFHQGTNPTQATYLGTSLANYIDGSTSRFGLHNIWSSGAGVQGLDGLRNWLKPGDANLDGYVDAADYVIWRSNQGLSGGWLEGDFNGDTMIDDVDYGLWRANFGSSPSGSGASGIDDASVPEPGTIALVMLLCGFVVTRIRHRDE